MRALDEVDYALMLFQRDQMLQYGNHLARAMLNRGDRLYLDQGQLKTRVAAHQSALQTGFAKAAQGIRCLLDIPALGQVGADSALALVPLGHPAEWPSHGVPVLLISCRPALCAPLSLRFFAQAHALTRTEEAVLGDLTLGLEVEEIARQRDMAVSTARSHVKQLRLKTRCTSMRELLNKLAILPPVVSAVRSLGP
jgi:DNA-binding CsgD family transcriptional regulator